MAHLMTNSFDIFHAKQLYRDKIFEIEADVYNVIKVNDIAALIGSYFVKCGYALCKSIAVKHYSWDEFPIAHCCHMHRLQ